MPLLAAGEVVLAATRTILLEQGDATVTTPPSGVSYEAWLVNTVVPMWLVAWVAMHVWRLMWRLGAKRRTTVA